MVGSHIWLLVPVLSGYLLLSYSPLTHYWLLRQSGYHLFLQSTLVGAGLVVLARLIVTLVRDAHPAIDTLQLMWADFLPFEHSGTASLTVLLAAVAFVVANNLVDPHKAARRVAYNGGDLIEWLLQGSIDDGGLVELSMRNGISYVGFPQESGIGARDKCEIPLIPLASGYRQEETGRLILTTSYSEVLLAGQTPADKLQVVIPVSEVISARHFDPSAHAQFQAAAEMPKADYELKRTADRQYMFDLHSDSPTGEIIAASERYATKLAAENGIASVRRNAGTMNVRDET